MKIVEVSDNVKQFFAEHVVPVYKVAAITPIEDGWEVDVEVIEEEDYMAASAKDDMIGVYKVVVDEDMDIVSFTRTQLRPRGSIDE